MKFKKSRLLRRRRDVLRLLCVLVLAPITVICGLTVLYRWVPPQITPLMVLRLVEGERLRKSWVPLEEIAPVLPRSVVAAEDNHFCRHGGFDWGAMERAWQDFREGTRLRGGSTITMQTAKNLFLWPDRSLLRKALEAPITALIEALWPKRRIMEVYLNIAEWGPGIYGAEAAAGAWFGKSAADLTAREAALLAVVLPAPRSWSPAAPTDYVSGRGTIIARRVGQLGPLLNCLAPPD